MLYNKTNNYIIISQIKNYRSFFINYLDRLDLSGKFVFVLYFQDLMPDLRMNAESKNISWIIPHILEQKKLAEENNQKFIILVDCAWEAPTYRHNLKQSLTVISNNTGIPVDSMIIYSGAQNQFGDPVKFCVNNDMICTEQIFFNTSGQDLPIYHFISLARIAKPHRVYTSVEILDRGLDKYGNMSLGCGYYNGNHENYDLRLVPEKYKHLMPLYIDGPVIGRADQQQHVSVDERFYKAFVNVVMETCFDAEVSPFTWNGHLISEKTFKAFAWGQVPILITLSNSVQYLRDFGFDMFDDIIDHGYYDTESDPMLRIKKAVDQLEKICQWSIQDCQNYKENNMHRFVANRRLAEQYQEYKKSDMTFNNLKKVIDEI